MSLTPEQLEARKNGIGGSDAPIVCGLSPYKTPYQLWLEKAGQEEPEDISGKEIVHFGNVLENVVAEEYVRRSGNKVRRVNKTLYHPEHKFMLAHIDRDIVALDGVLECKTTNAFRRKAWGEEGTDDLPLDYLCQGQHILSVTGKAFIDFAVLIGGNEYRGYKAIRDEDAIEAIIFKEKQFWECVENKTPPPPVNLEDIKAMYAEDRGTPIEATAEILVFMAEYQRLQADEQSIKADLDDVKLKIQEYMGDNAILTSGGREIATWKTSTSNRFDTKRFKKENPDVAKQYTKEGNSRRFLVKG